MSHIFAFMDTIISAGKMPKVKHGRRHYHDKLKNSERHQSAKSTGRTKVAQLPTEATNTPAEPPVEDFFSQLQESSVENWHVYKAPECVELSQLHNSPPQPSAVKISLTIYSSLCWTVRLYGKLLTTQPLLRRLPSTISTFEELRITCTALSTIVICSGNDEKSFVQLLEERGGAILNKGSVAYVDKTPYCTTVRHVNCHLICEDGKQRCSPCLEYRPTLRAMRSRSANKLRKEANSTAAVNPSSHTNYRYLSNEDLKKRLTNVQNERRVAEKRLKQLKDQLNAKIDEEGVDLAEEDIDDLSEIFAQADQETTKLTREHFQRVFWEQQKEYNELGDKRRIRWHPLMIRFALNLRYLSSSAYRALSNFIALPSKRTLCDYTHVIQVTSGVSYAMINRFKDDASGHAAMQNMVGLLFDEMKVKSGLVFNKKSGKLIGFVDLGQYRTVNLDHTRKCTTVARV